MAAYWLTASLAVVVFMILFKYLGIIKTSQQIILIAKNSIELISDKNLDALELEKQTQANAINMIKMTIVVAVKFFLCGLLPVVFIYVTSITGYIDFNEQLVFMLEPAFLVISCVIITLMVFLFKKTGATRS